ncbi:MULTISPECIES: glycosyltransferase family 4 protein [unclassified Acidovorax]|uniref:glycosyltransferase family 4 protein n=1 Tax=unclassified Acidovorax TaxID=2684926 RepID=UPI000B406F35|nr:MULTISPECIES: glycosyltransferase family 4 protein [unclassified Acidovorax]
MKILFILSNISFPPVEGAHEQTLRVIDGLSKRGYRCSLLVICKKSLSFDQKSFCENYPNLTLLKVFEDSSSYSSALLFRMMRTVGGGVWRDEVRDKFLKCQSDFDLVHAEGIPLAPLVFSSINIPFVLSVVDAWSLRQFRLGKSYGVHVKAVARFVAALVGLVAEIFLLPRAEVVHVVSSADAGYLTKLNPRIKVRDISVALPMVQNTEIAKTSDEQANSVVLKKPTLVFSGDIRVGYIRDGLVSFLVNVFPKLLCDFPGLKLLLLCRASPVGALHHLIKGDSAISVFEWVPDYAAAIKSADIVVLPDANGTGQKNRTVQALSLGVPVVGSPAAFEGVGIKNWRQGVIAKTPEEFVFGIRSLLTRPSLAVKIATNAERFAISRFSLSVILSQWDNLYRDALNAKI